MLDVYSVPLTLGETAIQVLNCYSVPVIFGGIALNALNHYSVRIIPRETASKHTELLFSTHNP